MMKTVVISSTDNDDYLFFVPIVSWAWAKFGWNVICFMNNDPYSDKRYFVIKEAHKRSNIKIFTVPSYKEYREETIAQCYRLYAGLHCEENEYVLTSDVDMMPLSDYWEKHTDGIFSYGRDLTDYHNPICYIGMLAKMWKKVMNLDRLSNIDGCLLRDLKEHPKSLSNNFTEWWQVDQDIITERLSKFDVIKKDRGIAPNSHYPLGRIDRGSWDLTLQQVERIDAHLLRPGYTEENFKKIMNLIKETFLSTQEEVKWMEDYRNDYIKLL